VDERGFRMRRIAGLDHSGFRHLQPKIVAFASALADASKHRKTAMILGDVVDEFHDDDGLAHASAAEQADLAALKEGLNQIDNLDAGLKHLRRCGLLVE